MPDSKISQLDFADKIYDHDLMVVVTGYATEGSYPDNCKISLDRIRKDIVRLDEMIFFLSGFSGYYNSGENTYTITSHHRMGNLIELDYDDATPHVQIISTTGINLRTENLLVRDHENTWPYSGIVYNTGLNAVIGNNIEIQFSSGTPASNIYGKTEGKYKSGIISTTGLNAKTQNNIVLNFDSSWPHRGNIYNTGLNARAGNNIEIDFSTNRHLNMGSPYHSGTISTTGLNMIAGTGIQYQVSNVWPYPYIVSQLDLRVVADNTFTHGPTTSTATVVDSGLYKDINWSLSNSKPLIDNSSSYCYIVEFFIKDLSLSNGSVPSAESKGRPTSLNGNIISWSTCNTIINPATVNIGLNGNNIINTNPSSNPTYNTSTNNIYLRYIEKRNLNSSTRIQPRYLLVPSSYTRNCNGTYFVPTPTTENPFAGYYQTTSWSDSGILETTLALSSYRHLKLDFSELVT